MPPHIKVGMTAYPWVEARKKVEKGIVRYVGKTTFQRGFWVGVELLGPYGDNNGALRGHAYFYCRPNHGLFVRAPQISLIPPESDNAFEDNSSTVEDRIQKLTNLRPKLVEISSLLRIKISKSMELLSQQLEVAASLEKALAADFPLDTEAAVNVSRLCSAELKLNNDLITKINGLLGT
jgi:dynactin complex subunit